MSIEAHSDTFIRPRITPVAEPAFRTLRQEAAPSPDLQVARANQETGASPASTPEEDRTPTALEPELTFDDVIDLINPLHHIPVVSTIYREMSGDTIAPYARTLGGFLFTGPIGLVAGAINGIVEEASGADFGGNLIAFFGGQEDAGSAPNEATAPPDPTTPPDPATPGNSAPAERKQIPLQADPEETTPLWSALPDAGRAPLPAQTASRIDPSFGGEQASLSGQEALRAYLSDMALLKYAGQPVEEEVSVDAEVEPREAPTDAPANDMRFYSLQGVQRHRMVSSHSTLVPNQFEDAPPPDHAAEHTSATPLNNLDAINSVPPPDSADGSVADRMMQALQKYEAMVRRRHGQDTTSSQPSL